MRTFSIIGDRNGRVWPAVLDAVRESRAAGRRVMVYVPEQLTLRTERDLILGLNLPGLLDLDVVSPRGLERLVREYAGSSGRRALKPAGAAMGIYRTLSRLSRELKYYRDAAGLYGAAGRLGNALEELRDSGMTLEELEAWRDAAPTGAERARMHDLALLWRGWDELLSTRFEDARGAWTDMVGRLPASGVLNGVSLIVYGFDTVRPDLRELLLAARGPAGEIRVFLTMDEDRAPDGRLFAEQRRSARELAASLAEAGAPCEIRFPHRSRPGVSPVLAELDTRLFADIPRPLPELVPGDALTLYAAASPGGEVRNLAETLIRWHGEGIAWNAMAVALPRGSELESALCAALRLRRIPFTAARKTPASAHGLFRLLLSALRCVSGGDGRDVKRGGGTRGRIRKA